MICFPTAKINIGLNIIEKRKDGFHSIESIFHPVNLCDALEIVEGTENQREQIIFTSSGIDIPGSIDTNLCSAAYRLINKNHRIPPIKIHLHKNIPIGAGLGGGSADAAFFIRLVNNKFSLGMSITEMEGIANQLGSDCSFFIHNQSAFCTEKGDVHVRLEIDLNNYHIGIVNPNIHINTAHAYAGVKPNPANRILKNDIRELPIERWKGVIHNDFEDSIFPQYPEIKKIKDRLYELGAEYASMSGSGSSVYGIFKKETPLKDQFKNYFVWEGKL